jgi:hypothetical protein
VLIKRQNEAAWRSPAVTAYDDEAAIQNLLAQTPDLLPGAEQHRLAVAREVALEAGYVDVVGVAPDGAITLVECKLRANSEIRRHVVGQVLAYAATLWELDYEAFDQAFAARAGMSLAHAVQQVADDDWDEETFRAAVSANLASGRLRLIIAVDQITPELQRIVRFLNGHTTPELEVLALELRYVADSGVEILFPTVFGQESAQSKGLTPAGQKWTEERFFTALGAVASPSELLTARRLYAYAQNRGATLLWGVGPLPSVSARLPVAGKPVSLITLYEWPKGQGKLAINFEYLVGNASTEQVERLTAALRAIPGCAERLVGLEDAGFKKRPTLPLDLLARPEIADAVLRALDTLLGSGSAE